MNGAITPLPLYACMVWTGATLHFHTMRFYRRASIDAHSKTTVSAAPIFTNVVPAQHHYMKISCTEFHPNQTRNVENKAEIILCPSVKYIAHNVLIFKKLVTAQLCYFF